VQIERTRDVPENWDLDADLVVLGSGGAGLTGALVAAIEGADALVLEKADVVGGTTSLSGGGVWVPLNHHMADVGVEDSREDALTYLRAVAGPEVDEQLVEQQVDTGHEMVRYLEERAGLRFRAWPPIGGTLDYRPDEPGARHGGRPLDPERVAVADLGEWAGRVRTGPGSAWVWDKLEFYTRHMHAAPPSEGRTVHQRTFVDVGNVDYSRADSFEYFANGTALVAQLLRGCLDQGVRILTETPAHELVVDDGRVVGVKATAAGDPLAVRARHGVLLATGGFEFNAMLKRLFLDRPLEYCPGARSNEGDGHLMGMAVGAQVANLADAWWCPMIPIGSDSAEPGDAVLSREERALPHTMIVNREGRRFVNESTNYYDITEAFGTRNNQRRNLPAWLVLDQQFRDKYALLRSAPPPPEGKQPSWLVTADTLEELAERLGIDPAELRHTTERFNAFARAGRDPDFRRGASTWDREWGDPAHEPNPALGTVEKPPFCAIELRPGALATKSGLRINADGEVLSADDQQPIPGLYASGNVSANAVPYAYTGPGSTLGPALTFSYVVGRRAAALARAGAGDEERSNA
jgi:3-oxosteroid 1-dehydrogenase